MATAGGIITHGRATSENSLEQEDDQQAESDDELRDSYIQNQIYLFVSMVMNGHESFASVEGDDEGDDEVPLEWARQMEKMSASSKAIALRWIRSARAGMQKRAGKGASLSEKQLMLTDGNATTKEGTFQSGKKSQIMRK